MIEKAYGKINLSINILNKRLDGYHDLDMIMVPIDLYDEVEIEVSDQPSYWCNVDLPFDEHNIVYQCIEVLRKEFDFKEQFKIRIQKNIPMQAGLAGGSSDGAATLRIINQLLKLGLSYSQLALFGKEVGSDIPFCIYSQTARVQGTGDLVIPFYLPVGYDLLLIKPKEGISTKLAYQLADQHKQPLVDMDALQKAFVNHEPLTNLLGNSLQKSAISLLPDISDIIEQCHLLGFTDVLMTGSGSTVFVIAKIGTDFSVLEEIMKNKYDFVVKTRVLTM